VVLWMTILPASPSSKQRIATRQGSRSPDGGALTRRASSQASDPLPQFGARRQLRASFSSLGPLPGLG